MTEKKMVPVQVLGTEGKSTLVAWDIDKTEKRGYVPAHLVMGHADPGYLVAHDDLLPSLPYGIPFAELLKLKVTPKRLETALHQAGIWTLEDLKQKDRVLIRIATDLIGAAVWAAAQEA